MSDQRIQSASLVCNACSYNRAGATQGACPECGCALAPVPAAHAYRPWLHRMSIALVCATFILVVAGGTVTSKGVGLAVPDWPTTYGYNMFLFPPSLWKGGVFWEHVHRLLGSLVGLMTVITAAWVWITQKHRPRIRGLALACLALVIVQGIMGGLRVTQLSIMLAILHGITAQIFLGLVVVQAMAQSRYWLNAMHPDSRNALTGPARVEGSRLRTASLLLLGALFLQLVLGATMRHTGSGLAIPDFPTTYGGFLPPMSPEAVQVAMDSMPYEHNPATGYYSVGQVHVHWGHRMWALGVIAALVWMLVRACGFKKHNQAGLPGPLARPLLLIVGLTIVQVALGALVIWSVRHTEIATAHQVTGASILATSLLLAVRCWITFPRGLQHQADPSNVRLLAAEGAA